MCMMDRREQELIRQISEESKDVKIPESLEPEAVKELLQARPKRTARRRVLQTAAAAACCLLVCGMVFGVLHFRGGALTGQETEDLNGASGGSGIRTAESYDEVYGYLKAYLDEQREYEESLITREYSAADSASGTAAAKESAAGDAGSYSETNVRQAGVDEADIVKTDGRYLYVLQEEERTVAIVDTEGGLNQAARVEMEEDCRIQEIYVSGGKLILVGEVWEYQEWADTEVLTYAATYDIGDPQNPRKLGEVTQSGSYTSSRLAEGYLYLFSRYGVDGTGLKAEDTESYVPMVNERLIGEDCIYLPVTEGACQYEVISSVDLNHPGETEDGKAVFAGSGELYVSGQNIYWYETQWEQSPRTLIRRISFRQGELSAEASGTVKGYIHDSFCIDEYEGNLRVVTTEEGTNSVYVLNGDLEVTGAVTGLAEDEQVYSARLLGDIGYFVTYRETDPLFSVDLSDPEDPQVIGALKIPGFSEYLHFYGKNRLLGIGMDTGEDGFSTEGIKLSMFDISDSTDVREEHKYVLEQVYSADVLYDYRAVLIDEGRNIIGFSADGGTGERYYVFGYNEEAGFECLMEEAINGNGSRAARGIYIDTILYVVKGNVIEAYSMENFSKKDDMIL